MLFKVSKLQSYRVLKAVCAVKARSGLLSGKFNLFLSSSVRSPDLQSFEPEFSMYKQIRIKPYLPGRLHRYLIVPFDRCRLRESLLTDRPDKCPSGILSRIVLKLQKHGVHRDSWCRAYNVCSGIRKKRKFLKQKIY